MTVLKCCVANDYRKCAVLAYWGYIDSCDSYDNYGDGVRGIINFVKGKGVGYKIIRVVNSNGVVVTEKHEALLYLRKASAARHVDALDAYSRIAEVVEVSSIAAALAYSALHTGIASEDWAMALKDAILAIRENVGEDVQPPLTALHGAFAVNVDHDKSFVRYLLGQEEVRVKRLLLEGRKRDAAKILLYLLVSVAPSMLPEEMRKFAETARVSLGAALSIVHSALISMLVNEKIESPEEAEEMLRLYGESDSNVKLVLVFAKEYLKAVRELESYYSSADRGVQHVRLEGRRAYVRIGGASGHYAIVWPSGSVLRLQYYDHDEKRMEALFGFLGKIGLEVRDSTVVIPPERIRDVALVLATLPSVDLQGKYSIYEEAGSVEELVEMRRG